MNEQAFHSIPMATAEVPSESMASKPVESKVVDVHVGNKRFKVIPELSWKSFLEREGILILQQIFARQWRSPAALWSKLHQGMASETTWFCTDILRTLQRTKRIGSKLKESAKVRYLLGEPTTSLFEPPFASVWIDPLGGLLAHF